ncbi:dGTP triphosphohydrolase [Oceanicola sp. S124]|uniref:dGTP triphosphohydrolase n=1 Tax=Oceanicola sp. S124 TaxID=1042378 RepID=UPI0002558D01|nr:dNTP triphosphohydrolase [Oceanicola sp. S124]
MTDWTRLLSSERLGDASYRGAASRSVFVQDHDRIVFSAPFRRLANKTQVHPLYDHDHIHHRLIHSIEVGSVGRSLAMRIGQWLVDQGELPPGDDYALANVVQAACVAHDIGNPPFGHSGEESIGDWFAGRFDLGRGLAADLDPALQSQFTAFEGNAQGFRILTRLEMYRNRGGMRLSKAVLGAFTKYPVTARTRDSLSDAQRAGRRGLKKFGLFSSEESYFAEVAEALGLRAEGLPQARHWHRHPLVLVVEAADDICYNIVDLEDAFTSGDLDYDTVRAPLEALIDSSGKDSSHQTRAEHIATLRAVAIGRAISACVEAFEQNYDAILNGTFPGALIEASDRAQQFEKIEDLARSRIFTSPRKTELEVSGRRVVQNVLDGVLPVYEDLAAKGWDAGRLSGPTEQLRRAISLDLRDVTDAESALHGLADFTSGMTDRYALRIARMLSGT